jgi:hypothetical protein
MGEIFDRATTLYVRYFRVFILITSIATVPFMALSFIATPPGTPTTMTMAQAIAQIEHPGTVHTTPPPPLTPAQAWLFGGIMLLAFLIGPLVQAAVAAEVVAAEDGRDPSFQDGLARAFARWVPLILTTLLFTFGLIAAYIALLIVVALVAVMIASIVKLVSTFGTIVAVLVGAFAVLAIIAVGVLVSVAFYFALYECALAGAGPTAALRRGFGLAFRRSERKRIAVLACFFFALCIAMLLLYAIVVAVTGNAAWGIPQVLLDLAISLTISTYSAVVMAVYYCDARARVAPAPGPAPVRADENEPEVVYADTRYATGAERARIHRFLDERELMSPAQRADTAAELAAIVRPRVPADLARLDDESLLERL